MFNIQGRQGIAEKNVGAQAAARDRAMQFAQQQYQNQLAKYGKQAGLAGESIASRQQQAQDVNRLYQGLGDVASTAGYINAGYVPRGMQKQQQGPAGQYQSPQNYDLGPAQGDEEDFEPGKRYLRSTRGTA